MSLGPETRSRAYSYVRFSTTEQGTGDSLRRQKEASDRYAAEHNLEMVKDDDDTLKDLGVSAFRGKNVKDGALGRFLQAVHESKVPRGSYLLVESLDRVSRENPWDAAETMRNIVREGVNVVDLLDNGKVYSEQTLRDDPIVYLMMIVRFMRAHEESRTKSERLSKAWANKRASAGEKKLTAMCPAWLEIAKVKERKPGESFQIVEARANIVRRIFREYEKGLGIIGIARELNQQGVPHFGKDRRKKSQGWHPSYIAKILKNPAVIGDFQPYKTVDGKRQKDGKPIRDYYPRITGITDDIFGSVQRQLTLRRNHGPDRAGHGVGAKGEFFNNLFSGITRCAYCGGKVKYENKGSGPKGGAYLVCDRVKRGMDCSATRWSYKDFETSFLVWVSQLDLESIMRSEDEAAKRRELEKSIQADEAELSETETDQLELVKTRKAMKRDSAVLARELERLEERISGLNESIKKKRNEQSKLVDEAAGIYKSKDQIKALIERAQNRKDAQTYKLRAQIAVRLRALVSNIRIRPAEIWLEEERWLMERLERGDKIDPEGFAERFPLVVVSPEAYFENLKLNKKGQFTVTFKNGIVRGFQITDDDPYASPLMWELEPRKIAT
jgi:DNA invertase Pin-like site-specific DNA recombinase